MAEALSLELDVFRNLFVSIAEEMGIVLRRTSFSPNIKERRDYSCAIYDARGETIAMGEGFAVHLAILAALALVSLATLPWAIAAALRQAGE